MHTDPVSRSINCVWIYGGRRPTGQKELIRSNNLQVVMKTQWLEFVTPKLNMAASFPIVDIPSASNQKPWLFDGQLIKMILSICIHHDALIWISVPATLGSILDREVGLMIPGMCCWTLLLSAASLSPRVWIGVSEKIKSSANGLGIIFVTPFPGGELTQTSAWCWHVSLLLVPEETMINVEKWGRSHKTHFTFQVTDTYFVSQRVPLIFMSDISDLFF